MFSGLRIVSLCTLLSRVLGLIRDMCMAAWFGNGVEMDAFSVAFRIPNLARRLFGEGALTAAFLPVFVREMEQSGRTSAWKLASAVLTVLALLLGGLVLVAELTLWGISLIWETGSEAKLLIGLTAALLPYMILICLTAQLSAVLHALGHFTWPALVPVVLNVLWIGGIWLIVPLLPSKSGQIYAVAGCIVAAGCLQLATLLPILRKLGFCYDAAWRSARPKVLEIGRAMLPIVIGLSITQLNVLADSLMAWGFSRPENGPLRMSLPGHPEYPLQAGTASALYFGQRMYQFPLGVFGVALGTVLFPRLSRHAEHGRLDRLRDDLSLGLRLVICVGVPASLGLVLLAEPLTVLIFQHGAFDSEDARQTVGMISAYGIAVWAYCGLLIVHRGYYAVGDRRTPLRVGLITVAFNLILNFTLIWILGGRGLALSTALSAMLQVVAIAWFIQTQIGRLDWLRLRRTTIRATAATAVMGLVCLITRDYMGPDDRLTGRLLQVFVPLVASILTYFAMARLLSLNELWLLFGASHETADPADKSL